MQLNTDKTSIVNFYLSHRQNYCDPVQVDDNISIEPSNNVKFLGILVDKHLTFFDHVDFLI